MTPAEQDIAVAFYLAWMPVETIAEWFDRDRYTITCLIRRRGVHHSKLTPNPNAQAIRQRRYRERLKLKAA